MSAPEQKFQPSQIDKLMQRMGAKRWDPIPPDHYTWMLEDKDPLIQFEGYLLAHTIAWPRRSEFAVDKDGKELHIEHIAADRDWEIHNARTYCRQMVGLGRCRMGTKAEGPRRLYLCGTVRRLKAEPEPAAKAAGVWPNPYPPYIWKQINELPEKRRAEFLEEDALDHKLQKNVHAELLAAERIIFDHRYDTRFARFGIENIREVHESKLTPEELEARAARIATITPAIERAIEGFGQTPNGSGQSTENDLAKPDIRSGQSATARATLLGLEPLDKPQDSGVRASLIPPPSPPQPTHRDGEKSFNQLPVPNQPAGATPSAKKAGKPGGQKPAKKLPAGDASDERLGEYLAQFPHGMPPIDHAQAAILYAGIPELQKRYPNAPFSRARFSALGKGDQQLTRLILAALAGDDAREFLESVDARCHAGDVQSLGLFVDLAKDFHRAAPERARRRAEWDAEERRAAEITEKQHARYVKEARAILASDDPKYDVVIKNVGGDYTERELARALVDREDAGGKTKGAGS